MIRTSLARNGYKKNSKTCEILGCSYEEFIKDPERIIGILKSENSSVSRWYKMRFSVLMRDSFRCQYCGMTPRDNIKLHVDHVIPVSKGGKFDINNLITACEKCNLGKHDVLIEKNLAKKLMI